MCHIRSRYLHRLDSVHPAWYLAHMTTAQLISVLEALAMNAMREELTTTGTASPTGDSLYARACAAIVELQLRLDSEAKAAAAEASALDSATTR